MALEFKNPPIVELISEVRWGMPTVGMSSSIGNTVQVEQNALNPQPLGFKYLQEFEQFFMRFTVEAHKLGFTSQERVVAPDAVVMPYQVIWRWKNPNQASPVIQLGIGVFAVNGSPPNYKNWSEFSSTLQDALKGLMQALEVYPGEKPKESFETLLRYIDRFDSRLTGDSTALEFMSDILGVKINIPDVITSCSNNPKEINPALRLNVPIDNGNIQLIFAKAVLAGVEGFMFDTTVTQNSDKQFNADNILDTFKASHSITNKIFLKVTEKIHEKMGIIQ